MYSQYMKAIKSTIGTNHPLVSPEDLNVMFYKIPDLHSIHCTFLSGLTKLASERAATAALADGEPPATLGDLFKNLASRLGAYSAYLKNYSRALETVQKCSAENNQFSEITRVRYLRTLTTGSVGLRSHHFGEPACREGTQHLCMQCCVILLLFACSPRFRDFNLISPSPILSFLLLYSGDQIEGNERSGYDSGRYAFIYTSLAPRRDNDHN